MKIVLTQHAKSKCNEFGITYQEAINYILKSREATINELAQIYYARRTHCKLKERYSRSKHLIYLKYCFVVYDNKDIRTIVTIYNPEYLFRSVTNWQPKQTKEEVIVKQKKTQFKDVVFAATQHFAERLLYLYRQGKKVFYNNKLCEVIDGDINYEPGIYIRYILNPTHKSLPRFVTKCCLFNFEVKDEVE